MLLAQIPILKETFARGVTTTQGEINALQKVILFLKFESEETHSLLYAEVPSAQFP